MPALFEFYFIANSITKVRETNIKIMGIEIWFIGGG